MNATQLFLVGVGICSVLSVCRMSQQILRRQLVSMKQRKHVLGSVEGAVLLVITTGTSVRYLLEFVKPLDHGVLPELSVRWIAAFGVSCAVYVGAKAARVLRTQSW